MKRKFIFNVSLFTGLVILAMLLIPFMPDRGMAFSPSDDAVIGGEWRFEKPLKGTLAILTPRITPMAARNGATVIDYGSLRTQVYKVTLTKASFYAASVSNDMTIATMPAKTIIHSVIADVTEAFVCSATCTTATLSATVGITAGGTEFLASFDLDAAIATFGDADAEMGSGLSVAGAMNGGYVHWAGTTIVMRATSGTGNWGAASVTNLSAGSVTIYILYSVLP